MAKKEMAFSDDVTPQSDSTSTLGGDENKDRGNWTGKLDFFLSCVGYAVGLGNIWRFPIMCYRNGGATFLIPYLFFMVVCGIPLFALEVCYGQFSSLSPVTAWRMSPLFKGIGYGMVIISAVVCIYYNIIITWTFFYLFASVTTKLPWSDCSGDWTTSMCRDGTSMQGNNTEWNVFDDGPMCPNKTDNETEIAAYEKYLKENTRSPSDEFWTNRVLQLTDGIETPGSIQWELFGCLLLAWVCVFLCLCRGIKSSGRVVYVTATFPYVVLMIFFVRGITLPGAWIGLEKYFVPDMKKLMTMQVWSQAASQIFYSIGAAWGALITMASYNKFNHNCLRDAIVVPVINCMTSVFAGCVIFSILGFMAHVTCRQSIEAVVADGPGLIFVVYPAAVAILPAAPMWSILFFLMIFTLGLDSQFGMFETLTSAFIDEFPNFLRPKKVLFIGILCAFECLIGISMVTHGGMYVLHLIDWYSSTYSLMVLSLLECIAICWVYGLNRFCKDIEMMTGTRPNIYFRAMWSVVTPLVVVFILVSSLVRYTAVEYKSSGGGTVDFPVWSVIMGWCTAAFSLIPLIICSIQAIMAAPGDTLWQRIKNAAKPARSWGPALDKHRRAWFETLTADERSYYLPSLEDETEISLSDNPLQTKLLREDLNV